MQPLFLGRSFKEWPFLFNALASLILLTAFISCSNKDDMPKDPKELDQQTLFSVDDIDVSTFEFNQAYLRYIIKNGRNDTKEERLRFLSRWKENLLLAQEALNQGYNSSPIYKEAVEAQERKTTADTYFVKVMNDLMPEITDEELRLAFAKSKRKVYPRQLYATTKEALMPYYERLEEGADFIQLANEFYGTASYDSLAGSLGQIGYYSVDDVFAEKAFSLNQGAYSEPFQTKLGWHIIWVEHLILEAMLAEDEYQIKKGGTLSKYRTRRANLAANEYIKDQMMALDVLPNKDALIMLNSHLNKVAAEQEEIDQTTLSTNPEFWDNQALNSIEEGLDRSQVLATYNYNGGKKNFTVGDYINWLPYLSANESKARTGASVGRAIRNEYFYLEGLAKGENTSFEVKRAVRNRGLDVLSQLYQKDIIGNAIQDTTKVEIPTWFVDRLYPNQSYTIDATYSYLKAKDAKDATTLKKLWEESPENILDKGNFKRISNQQMDASTPLFVLVSKAILNSAMVAKSKEYGWIVLKVKDREFKPIKSKTLDREGTELQQQYRAYTAMQDSLEKYGSKYEVEIDTSVFNRMYKLDQ